MSKSKSSARVLVTGAGGFIGHHLVTYLKERGYWVRGADLKHPEFAASDADEFLLLDLRRWPDCLEATAGCDEVYALAADMGGMGFISCHHAEILHNNLPHQHAYAGRRQEERRVSGTCTPRPPASTRSTGRPAPT
jgi:nucleoside-diphosphate-sugar epimerase